MTYQPILARILVAIPLVFGVPSLALAQGESIGQKYQDAMAKVQAEYMAKIAAGDKDARLDLARYYRATGNYEAQQAELRKAADLGDARAHFLLTKGYEAERWPKEPTAESRGIAEAAKQGSASAMFNLGLMYEYGRGETKDGKAALAWYQKAAEAGEKRGLTYVGRRHDTGTLTDLTPNLDTALAWYDKAASANDPHGLYNWALTMKLDFKAPLEKYLPRLKQAAALGYPPAQSTLATMYLDGSLPRSEAEAVKLATDSANAGNPAGYIVLARLNQRDGKLEAAARNLRNAAFSDSSWGEGAVLLGRMIATEDVAKVSHTLRQDGLQRLQLYVKLTPRDKESAEVLYKARIAETMRRARDISFDPNLKGMAAAAPLVCLQAETAGRKGSPRFREQDLISLFTTIESYGVKLEDAIASNPCNYSDTTANALRTAYFLPGNQEWFQALDAYFSSTRGSNAAIDTLLRLKDAKGQTGIMSLDNSLRNGLSNLIESEREYRRDIQSAPASVLKYFKVEDRELELDQAALASAMGVAREGPLWEWCTDFAYRPEEEKWTGLSAAERQGRWTPRGMAVSLRFDAFRRCEAAPDWARQLNLIRPHVLLRSSLFESKKTSASSVKLLEEVAANLKDWCEFDGLHSPRSETCKLDTRKAVEFAKQWSENRQGMALEPFEAAVRARAHGVPNLQN